MNMRTIIRPAQQADRGEVERLSELEGRPAPAGPLVVAEVDGRLWAAVSIAGGDAVADPFQPSGPMVAAARAHATLLGERPPERRDPARRRTTLRRRPPTLSPL